MSVCLVATRDVSWLSNEVGASQLDQGRESNGSLGTSYQLRAILSHLYLTVAVMKHDDL